MKENYTEYEKILPLSPIQHGMLFHYIYHPDRTYVEQMTCRISGDLDLHVFTQAINAVIANRDMLRAVIVEFNSELPKQAILRERIADIIYFDYNGIDNPSEQITKYLSNDLNTPFNLTEETYRFILFKLDYQTYIFACTYHHIIIDAWSEKIVEEEFCKAYYLLSSKSTITKEEHPYANYLMWINDQDEEKARHYWRDYLSGLQVHRQSRTTLRQTGSYKCESFILDGEMKLLVEEAARHYKCTSNIVLLSIWGMYLIKHFQKPEVLFGCVVFGRMISLKNVSDIVGLFVNCIPIRICEQSALYRLISEIQLHIYKSASYCYMSLSDILACGEFRAQDINTCVNFSIDVNTMKNKYTDKLSFVVSDMHYEEQASYSVYLDIFIESNRIRIDTYFDTTEYYFESANIKNLFEHILLVLRKCSDATVADLLHEISSTENKTNGTEFNF